MANPITAKDVAEPAKITPSSALQGYSAADLLAWTRPHRVWKASAAISTADNVVIDFGFATPVSAIFIDNLNVNSILVQGNATDSWGTPSFSQTLSVALDRGDGRYKVFAVLSSFNYRYLRVRNNSASSLNGEAVWQVGSIVPFFQHTLWAAAISYPYEISFQADILGQGNDVVRVGNRYAEIRMSHGGIDAGTETSYADVFGYGEAEPFVFFRNYLSAAEAYPVRRVGPASLQQTLPSTIAVPPFTLREYS